MGSIIKKIWSPYDRRDSALARGSIGDRPPIPGDLETSRPSECSAWWRSA